MIDKWERFWWGRQEKPQLNARTVARKLAQGGLSAAVEEEIRRKTGMDLGRLVPGTGYVEGSVSVGRQKER